MKNIIAFAGSNSKTSINKQLAIYASSLVEDVEVNVLDLNEYNLPLFGTDLESEAGIPDDAHKLLNILKNTDGIVLSLAEHNGAYSVAFKNVFDWLSRIEGKLFFNKPMLLMATSPGGRGGQTVLDIAKGRFPFHDGNIIETFSLPFFNENFREGKIVNEDLDTQLKNSVKQFQKAL
ncbi:NAD(P)H-dependent oxidoreductase [Tamlana sp. 62-3]|uniref:NAD(P)H-dependent oxidoreductase n=1 Tax=Neotamlana sargassicola TaxID=2883125 RepID=A0A9X1I788_9FLAO|nr:NAD(P)H-dependent oxidoreductase [Tamlana sargassicola]MCB4808618.1 NAD(P)H-dependent oxidoreductase [Tamlana sargassicola]